MHSIGVGQRDDGVRPSEDSVVVAQESREMVREKRQRQRGDEEIWLEEARGEMFLKTRAEVRTSDRSEPVANDRTLWSASRVSVDDAVRGDDLFQGVPRYDGRACDAIYATVQKQIYARRLVS